MTLRGTLRHSVGKMEVTYCWSPAAPAQA